MINTPAKAVQRSEEVDTTDEVRRTAICHNPCMIITDGEPHFMKILIAVEDKEFTAAISDFLCTQQRWNEHVEFKIIHVVEPLHPGAFRAYSDEFLKSYAEERERSGRSLIMSIGNDLKQQYPSAQFSEEVLNGHVKEVIIDTARDWNADLIVVGSHGRRGVSQFLLGSVSMSVLSTAPCAVMIVKLPPTKDTEKEAEKETRRETSASAK